jgi:competence protein ComEC
MPVFAVSALVGVIGGFWLPVMSTAAAWPIALLVTSVPVFWLTGGRGLCVLAGFAASSLASHWYLDRALPADLVRQDIVLQGYIADTPVVTGAGQGFHVGVTQAPVVGSFPQKIYLKIYGTEPRPLAGECWQLHVRLKKPYSTVNSGVRDREIWALWNGVHARGYIRSGLLNRRLASACRTPLLRLRRAFSSRMRDVLPDSPVAGLVEGITLGIRSGISPARWNTLRDTGTAHLMAISGLHIGLLAVGLWWPGRWCGWVINSYARNVKPLAVARLLALAGALGYAALAGFSVATLRASCMVALALALGAAGRRISAAGILAAALLCALALNPGVVLASGFWLSYLAVALLIFCITRFAPAASGAPTGRCAAILQRIAHAARTQLLLCFGLALPGWLLFAQVSLIAPLANMVAVPVFSFLILPAALLGLACLFLADEVAATLLSWSSAALEALLKLLDSIAGWPWAVWYPADGSITVIFLLAVAVACCLLPRPVPGRIVGLPLLLLAGLAAGWPDERILSIRIIDAGQGQAVLIQTARRNILYDTGPAWPGGNAGQTTVVPLLRSLGIKRLDAVLVSHEDADHSGGADSIVRAIPTDMLLRVAAKADVSPPGWWCQAPLHWRWDGVSFAVLHPVASTRGSDNNRSCVLLITVGNTRILLPGDIERQAEHELLARAEPGRVNLVLAPHHGSRTSSSDEFVTALQADYVVFSAGYANRWNFPDSGVVDRWRDSGSCVLVTATTGSIQFVRTADGNFQPLTPARSTFRRPWALRNAVRAGCSGTVNAGKGGV